MYEPEEQEAAALRSRCQPWADGFGIKLEFEIGGKQVRFVEQGGPAVKHNQQEETIVAMDILQQCQKWQEEGRYQEVIDALEAVPPEERTAEMDSELARAYNNLAAPEDKELFRKAIALLENSEFTVRVLQLPRRLVDGEYVKQDVDDFIKFHGAAAFEGILNGSENQMDFRMDAVAAKYDLSDDQQRISYAGEVSQLIASLPNAVEREVYAGRAAERAGISREAMLLEVKRAFGKRKNQERRALQKENQKKNPPPKKQPEKKVSTNTEGRIGGRPYARGRSYVENRYENEE